MNYEPKNVLWHKENHINMIISQSLFSETCSRIVLPNEYRP